jgi:hypothetical protein
MFAIVQLLNIGICSDTSLLFMDIVLVMLTNDIFDSTTHVVTTSQRTMWMSKSKLLLRPDGVTGAGNSLVGDGIPKKYVLSHCTFTGHSSIMNYDIRTYAYIKIILTLKISHDRTLLPSLSSSSDMYLSKLDGSCLSR